VDCGADLEVLGWDALEPFEGGGGERWVCAGESADGSDRAALFGTAVTAEACEVSDERGGVLDWDARGLLVGGPGTERSGHDELGGDVAQPFR